MFCFNVNFELYCVSFWRKNVFNFLKNESLYLRETSKKCVFHTYSFIGRHYNVESKWRENDAFLVRYFENDNGDLPPRLLITFLIEGVIMYNIRKRA